MSAGGSIGQRVADGGLVAVVLAVLDGLTVDIPAEFSATFQAVAEQVGLAHRAQSPPLPHELASAWRRFLNSDQQIPPGEKNSLERICMLACILQLTSAGNTELERAFRAERMGLDRSRTEMRMRLGSRLYMTARSRVMYRAAPETCRRLFAAAIDHLSHAIVNGEQLTDHARLTLHGMRGVARVLLSRTDNDIAALEAAVDDLQISRQLGDQSHENWEYRREGLMRLLYLDVSSERVLTAAPLFDERGKRDRQYYLDLANYHSHHAAALAEKGEIYDTLLTSGVTAASAGLALPADERASNGMFKAGRGFIHMLRYQRLRLVDEDAASVALDEAIADLQAAALEKHGGANLSRCLMFRAQRMRADDPSTAMKDLEEASACITLARPELAAVLESEVTAAMAECGIRLALGSENWREVLEHCRTLTNLDAGIDYHSLSLAHALRSLLDPKITLMATDAADARTLATIAMERLWPMADRLPDDNAYATMFLKHIAGLSNRLDRGSPSLRSLELCQRLVAREVPPGPVSLANLGSTALKIAKRLSKEGSATEAATLFDDAIVSLGKALEAHRQQPDPLENFQEVVCQSKLGEAYLRRRGPSAVAKAIEHLEEARRLGNESPELSGLLGDAYYRRGIATGSMSDLHTAVECKAIARSAGHQSRESASVIGRIHAKLHDQSRDTAELRSALVSVFEAHTLDPAWPWPLFQLAELCHAISASPDALDEIAMDQVSHPVRLLVGAADRIALLQAGIQLAVSNDEFARKELGGRSGVFVLEDPHRLLSATMVLKPTRIGDARREMEAAHAFSRHLREKGLRNFDLPTPIGTVETGSGTCIYAMERAAADPLARLLVGVRREGYVHADRLLARCAEFLAEFHLWAGVKPAGPEPVRFLSQQLVGDLRQLGASSGDCAEADQAFKSLVPVGLPLVRKKDAHAENWLVTGSGRIVMIDLESSRPLPALYEIVQLIDDYPAFRMDGAGWDARASLAERYWTTAFGTTPPAETLLDAYRAFLAHRCVVGAARLRAKSRRGTSSSALGAIQLRYRHYRAGAEHLATCGSANAERLGTLISKVLVSPLPGAAAKL